MELNDRISLVFGSLNTTLKSVNDPPLKEDPKDELLKEETHQSHDRRSAHDRRSVDRHKSGRSRDCRPRGRVIHVPDYVKNPDRWTKYDLIDDGSDRPGYEGLTGEQANRKAAFDFLNKLRGQNVTTPSDHALEDTPGEERRHEFKRPRSLTEPSKYQKLEQLEETSHGNGHYTCKTGTLSMPEYVVGLTKRTRKLPSSRVTCDNVKEVKSSTAVIHLSHLAEEEEDDED